MPPDDYDAGEISSEEVETVFQDMYFRFFEASLGKIWTLLAGRRIPGLDEYDIALIAWDRLGREFAKKPRKYLRRPAESEKQFHNRIRAALRTIISRVIYGLIKKASVRIPSTTQFVLPGTLEFEEVQETPIETNPWSYSEAERQWRSDIIRAVNQWGVGLDDGPRTLLGIIAAAAPHKPTPEEVLAELRHHLGPSVDPGCVDLWTRQLRRKARQDTVFRNLFYTL